MLCAYSLSISRSEKVEAKCATLAASVLPRVFAADPAAAEVIYESTKVGASFTDYQAVWTAFESVYSALGITAGDIGTFQGIKNGKASKKRNKY